MAETYSQRITELFARPAETIGEALQVAEHSRRLFVEGDLRGHLIFPLSRLVDAGLHAAREQLRLPPWDAIIPGTVEGRLLHLRDLQSLGDPNEPVLLLLDRADGDEEIASTVKGVVLAHPLPHLSHLAVRARQAGIAFAVGETESDLAPFKPHLGSTVRMRITPDGVEMHRIEYISDRVQDKLPTPRFVADHFAGAKAATAERLWRLAEQSNGLFRAPRSLAIPFVVLEQSIDASGERANYQRLLQGGALENLAALRQLILHLDVPEATLAQVRATFASEVKLAVRSSSNGEDLEGLAGAGLYDSILNVTVDSVATAIRQVWASSWSRRAVASRQQAGIAHERMRMGVLIQELIAPDFSFILHTAHPQTGERYVTMIELAAGLGEVLASAVLPGSPCRLTCHRHTGEIEVSSCANYSFALRPGLDGQIQRQRLDYSRLPQLAQRERLEQLGRRLARIGESVEDAFAAPQDIEGVIAGDDMFVVQSRPQQGL